MRQVNIMQGNLFPKSVSRCTRGVFRAVSRSAHLKLQVVAGALVAALFLVPTSASPGTTTRVGLIGLQPAISADGRFVAFVDDLGVSVHDRQTGTTTRVSVASDGTEANGVSGPPAISADGRFVAFVSDATNLVSGDTNGARDIFVHDRQTGTTTRVSVASDGTEGNAASNSYASAISADGRFVAFVSGSDNLVPGDTNGAQDIFVHDRQTGTTTRVSVASDGTEANRDSDNTAISADGRFVAFMSDATNLGSGDTNGVLFLFVHDRQTGETTRLNVGCDFPAMSADGRFVACVFGGAFVHDRLTGITEKVSVASNGTEGNTDNSLSSIIGISADGRFVAFDSFASNLVLGDTNNTLDIFVHDRQTGTTTRVSVASDGTEGNGDSVAPAISADGRFVAFTSWASNLVPGDINGSYDVFLHDLISSYNTTLTLPFSIGETWYVCQGYNGPVSHRGVAALDLSIDAESFAGRHGCSPDTHDASTGKVVLAPAVGTVKAHIKNEGEEDMLCLELEGIAIMKIGHLTDILPVGATFKRDDALGRVAGPSRGNGDYAHIHVQLQDLSAGCRKAETIPFSGQYRFEGAPDMPYDDNGTPNKPRDDPKNQWRGTVLTRTR